MNKYHFDITPHIVKQLGEQLVSDEITALLELIKNSYDADASYVSIEINTTGKYLANNLFYPEHNGFIVVEDDGFGMSEDTIMKSWLIISYSQKRALKDAKKKTPKGRTPLGDKGLGRLSTQRLADVCEIFTNEENTVGSHLGFNWKDFELEESLGKVVVQSENYNSQKKNGTTLVLANLNHPGVWEGKNLEKFKGLISEIISPYSENKPFEVFLKINNQNIELEKSNKQLENLAISRFSFSLNEAKLKISGKNKLDKFIGQKKDEYRELLLPDNGRKFKSFLQTHLKSDNILFFDDNHYFIGFDVEFNFDEEIPGLEIHNGERANPGSFFGKIDEFSFDNYLNEDDGLKNVFGSFGNYKTFVQSQTGIKVYRNGFAVKPFGLGEDKDWLRLSESQTKTSFYDLRPNNVIGYFAIDEGENHELKDKTDREGLISNAYSRNFFVLANFIKNEINRHQRTVRKAYDDYLKIYKTENSGIKTVNQAFNQLKATKDETEEVKDDFKNAVKTVNKAIADSSNIVKAVKGNPLFSTELEKQTAGKVESILQELKGIQSTLQKLEKIVKKTEKLNEVIDILEPKINILETQLNNFSELASLGLITETVSHEFASIADRLAEKSSFYSNKLQRKNLSDSDIYVLMEYINTTVNGLKVQLRHLDPALKYNREKKASFKVSNFIKEEKDYYSNRFKKNDIEFAVEITEDFTIEINRGKLTQIIDNLFNNSEYWLIEKKQKETKFIPKISVKIEMPWIYIFDNGYGIAPAIESQIFEPFVTTKPQGVGRGLGLFITQQLLDAEGCYIALDITKNEYNKRFIFGMNLANITI